MMVPSTRLLPAASLIFKAASAMSAAAPVLEARAAAATDAWVSVDVSGTPVTVTPIVTVVGGNTTTISAIPTELTATSLVRTEYGELTTSTGTAAAEPTATNTAGAGAFLVCSNADGAYTPFCLPTTGSSMYSGTTYYVTWDASVLNSTNTAVVIEGSYVNDTTGEAADQAFSSDKIKVAWGYYAWTIDSSLLSGPRHLGVNITLFLNEVPKDDDDDDSSSNTTTKSHLGPTVLVTKRPTYRQQAPTMPKGAALYIGLPTVLGFCVVMIVGVCIWNQKARRIGLGNVMSRARHGYGVGKSRARRMRLGRRDKKGAMRLMDQVPEEQHYRDQPRVHVHAPHEDEYDEAGWAGTHQWVHHGSDDGAGLRAGHARRDSDALGSLAGTPTSADFSFPPEQQREQQGSAMR